MLLRGERMGTFNFVLRLFYVGIKSPSGEYSVKFYVSQILIERACTLTAHLTEDTEDFKNKTESFY